jgi:hypothetical protein
LLVGTRLPVPRGKHIALAGAAMVVADLTDEPAGQNAFAFSQPAEPSYFTTASTAVVDSKDGKALVGIQSNLTSVFLSKRDAIYQAAVGAIVTATEVEASIRPVNDSDGVGAGDTNAQNLIYGCGERGAFVFDGSNLNYLSRPIEPTWQQIADRSNEALRTMQGAYVRAFSEYWLSLRRRGAIEKTDLLVMDLESQSWWLLTAPEHRTMEIVESVDGQQQDLLIGTTSGAVMHYQESVFVDGSNDAKLSNAAQTLSGDTGLSGSGTSLSMAGANFDTTLGGLAGIEVEIVYNGGTATRRIVSNTAGTLRWLEPLAGWSSFTSFAIGGYEGRWTSPWITESDPNREQNLLRVSAELIPDAVVSDLTIRVASVRQTDQVLSVFPTVAAAYEEFTRPQSTGWLVDMPMPRTHNRGHYHRVQFSTRGVRTPFGLVGYGLQIVDASATAHAGRTT